MSILVFNIGFLNFSWIDAIDIILVSILLYQLYKLLYGSVALKIFLGLLFIYLFYQVINALNMQLLSSILGQFIGVGVIVAVILFQQEIRRFLLIIGRSTELNNEKFYKFFSWKSQSYSSQTPIDINIVVKAAKELSSVQEGALIVFAKSSELKFYMESGDMLDALISKRLLITIFNKTGPLHDGAVIVADGRIKAARCIIPVTEKRDLPAHYGLRHRAAIGLTEVTDSIVLVVSEETGQMSLAYNGQMEHNLTTAEIRVRLVQYLYPDNDNQNEPAEKKGISQRVKKKKEAVAG